MRVPYLESCKNLMQDPNEIDENSFKFNPYIFERKVNFEDQSNLEVDGKAKSSQRSLFLYLLSRTALGFHR